LHFGYRNLKSENRYASQLQENGCWDFLEAFVSGEIDYNQYYTVLPGNEARERLSSLCGHDGRGLRIENDSIAPLLKNVVIITIESMSADFLEAYGNTEHLTPVLDSLIHQGLAFDNLFATGNRTVRGLEALTLSLPPCAGESIVKRENNKNLPSTGKLFREAGYSTRFFYGGDSYFDNMGDFFGGNGYEIVDKGVYDEEDITFANIWGTCDEDSYRVALRYFDSDYSAGKPFFAHIMTISNHRPYTYPDGRISYDGVSMSRPAAVKYSDWALGDFLKRASEKPWFGETVFVILADHCASSAGKTSLPVEKYHIPAVLYSPGFIEPRRVAKICSQIDLVPTLLSILHWSYYSAFYGRDILAEDFRERAFMATYQDLGFYADDILTVLSPVRSVKQFEVRRHDGWMFDEIPLDSLYEAHLKEAVAYYETVNNDHFKK
ncbi:MAG: LTA synthase family protein, partial [Bacteroidales bacterium]|nr:LTA synthase family protein [Bacteroidales bacterium]